MALLRSTVADFEGAEADKLDFVTGLESLGDLIENGSDSLFSVFLGETGFCCDSIDEISLIHSVIPPFFHLHDN